MSEISLPEYWKTEKLGQLCRVFSGYGFKTKDYTKEGIPLIKIGNLQDGEVIINPDNNYIPESWQQDEKLQRFILKSRDILIALTGMTGKTAVVPPSLAGAFLNQRVGKIEPTSPDAEQDFIFAVTKTRLFQEAIQQNTFRSVQGNISPSAIAQISIPLPPLPEQRAIAHILQTIQEAKSARQRELALERERKAALMDYLFSHGTKGELRKQTEIGEIPESWEVVRLGDIADITYGVQAAVAHLLDESVGLPILTNINITLEGTFDLSTLRYYELPKDKWDRLILERGDVLFNWRSGSQHHVGKTVLFDLDGKYTFSSFILRFRFVKKIKNEFALHYFHYLRKKGFFALKRSQSSVNSVFNASKSAEIPMVVPSTNEQSEISDVLQACDTKIAALEQEAARLDELFHAMLDELMTGKRSAVPLIDVESVRSAFSV